MKLIANLSDVDRKTTLQTGISPAQLMENAGRQVAATVQRLTVPQQSGVIVCGPGNNGGDGFVCARLLYEAGYQNLSVLYTGETYHGESLDNLEKLLSHLPTTVVAAKKLTEAALAKITAADFAVDALFGSGLNRGITGVESQLVTAINEQRQARQFPVIAVDMPSGINSANGQVCQVAVEASHTVTFATAKPGLYLFPGKAHAGIISVVNIGIPAPLIEEEESPDRLITAQQARQWLPLRQANSHKASYGHVLVIAGSQSMPGAAILSAEAAMSCGAGLVTLASPAQVFNQTHLMPEVMRLALPNKSYLGLPSVTALQDAFAQKKFSAVIIGPGLGQREETINALHQIFQWLKFLKQPVIIDADGLNALAQKPTALSEQFILTPHVGECARLLQRDNADIAANLLGAVTDARNQYQANIILKSASTVVATLGSEPEAASRWISPTGNPGMATAGSGDVLSGILGALAAQTKAQNLPLWHAATLGVYLHGLAGDKAAEHLTPYAMRASDITRHLPQAFHALLQPDLEPN